MGLRSDLAGQLIGLDTAPLIYFIEQHPTFHPLVRPFFQALSAEKLLVVTSTITLIEVLVQPLKNGRVQLVQAYREILTNIENLNIQATSVEIAEQAAKLRAKYNVRTPDAIQLATAIETGATFFLTNDKRLQRIVELDVLLPTDLIE